MKQVRMIPFLLILFSTLIFSQSIQGVRSALIASTGNANVRVLNCPSPTNAFTVEAWIYPMKMDENKSDIIQRYKNIPADASIVYAMELIRNNPDETPSLQFSISDGAPGYINSVNSGTSKIPFFAWTHVAGVYDGNNIRVFINGIESGVQPFSITLPSAGEIRMGLNIQPLNKRFFGFIDEVKYWNIPLNQIEIQSGMNGLTSPASITGLIGYWKFEDDTNVSNLLLDSSSSGSNGDYRVGAVTKFFTPFEPQGMPQISFSHSTLDFGTFEGNENALKNLTVTNQSSFTLVGYCQNNSFFVPAYGNITLRLYFESPEIKIYSNSSSTMTLIPTIGNSLPTNFFDVNNISMSVSRNGQIAFNGKFEWPKGSGKSCLYQAGLWLAAMVNGELHAACENYQSDFTAGNVINGIPADPANSRFRTYKITRGDSPTSNIDYAEWPADFGAPVNNDGSPKFLGDQTLFAVYNDLNSANHSAFKNSSSLPLGAEVKQITYGYNRPGALYNNVYLKYIITNHSNQTWTNAYAALWSDIDLGDAQDDFVGTDINKDIGFGYNGNIIDNVYGSTPPAVALHYLKGPSLGKPLTNSSYMAVNMNYPLSYPLIAQEAYNFLQSLRADGSQYIDPVTNNPTLFPLNGDPVTSAGWVDGSNQPPGDRMILINSGPFDLAPGASTELHFAITISQGNSNIDAVNVMRSDADVITQAYLNPPIATYTITTTFNDKGTISPYGQVTLSEGESITFTFNPNPGCIVKNVFVDGVKVSTSNSYTFNNVLVNHQLAVQFANLMELTQGVSSVLIPDGNSNLIVPLCPNPTNAFTVEAWIYFMRMPETEAMIIKRYKNIQVDSFFVYSLSLIKNDPNLPPSLLFKVSDGTPGNIISLNSNTVTLPNFTWAHVAGVFDGSNIKIFINGAEIASQPVSLTIPPAGEIRIGQNIQPIVNKRFYGFIDEVKYWNISLNVNQIESGMNGLNSPETTPSLIGYWKFEDDTNISNILFDSSPSGSNGIYLNGASTQLFTPFLPQGTPQISFSPSILDFGTIEMFESASKNFTLTNNSQYTLVGYYSNPFIVPPSGNTSITVNPSYNINGEIQPITLVANTLPKVITIPTTGNLMPIKFFDVNNINMRVTRNGRIALPQPLPESGEYIGLEWPKGSKKSCLYQAGLWLGANINGEIYAGIANHNTDYTAGSVVNGNPSGPSNARFRTYKINRCDNASTNIDYAEWPADLGAPVNEDGTPKLYGDQTLFTVYNDLNGLNHRALGGMPQTLPLGADVKQIVYGYNRPGALSNNVYLKFIITNRSSQTWTNTYAALWSDIDVGNASDDFAGVDIQNNLGYTYNAVPNDAIYGSTPPAVSLNYLKGPLPNQLITNFSYYNNGTPYPVSDPSNRYEVYNFLRGFLANGTPYIDPTNGSQTLFPLSGNPVTNTGWIDGYPIYQGDRRILISSGPFNLAPGASTELDFAITISAGINNIDAINVMRSDAAIVAQAYSTVPLPIYYINASCNDKGTISPSGQIIVNVGESKTFSFTPNPDNQIKSVTVDGVNIGRPNNYTFNNINECHLLAVLFDDTTPPVISLKEASVLWPANHKFSKFTLNQMIQSIHDCRNNEIPVLNGMIDSVSCDEPQNINGDGSTATDIIISLDCKSVEIRAERIGGGNGRVYIVYIGVEDSFGNYGTASYKVSVPANQGKGKEAIDDGPAYMIRSNCSLSKFSSTNEALEKAINLVPKEFQFMNYPNPFNPNTRIIYALPEDCDVDILAFNTLGQKIETLLSSSRSAGTYEFIWNAGRYPSGLYLVRINAVSKIAGKVFSVTRKLLLMK